MIECKIEQFHDELIDAVLEGFVNITQAVRKTLETLLRGIGNTIETSDLDTYTDLVSLEAFEWNATVQLVRAGTDLAWDKIWPMLADRQAVLRLVYFSVDYRLKEFQNGKKHTTHVKVTITFLEYQARFNQRRWQQFWRDLNRSDYAPAKAFVHKSTLKVPF